MSAKRPSPKGTTCAEADCDGAVAFYAGAIVAGIMLRLQLCRVHGDAFAALRDRSSMRAAQPEGHTFVVSGYEGQAGSWRADCRCGWQSPDHGAERAAYDTGLRHLIAMARELQPVPAGWRS